MIPRNIKLERREKARKVPDEFAFLQLENDDGGKVLDISEGGLRFESFAPVRDSSPIHFWFSVNLRERIEGWGELAWSDAGGKSGGLKFVKFYGGGHEKVCEYLSRSAPGSVSPYAGARDAADAGHLVPLQRHLAALRRQFIIGLLLGAVVAGIVTFATLKFSQSLDEHGTPAKTTGESPARAESPATSTSIASPSSSVPSRDVFAIGNQKKETATTRTPAPSPAESTAPTGLPKTPLTPDQLWALVQAGNSTAAAALAELYINGNGVPQSCAQARVLLLVASEKRNAAAIKRLANLDKEGCPVN